MLRTMDELTMTPTGLAPALRELPAPIAALPAPQQLQWLDSQDATHKMKKGTRRRIRRGIYARLRRQVDIARQVNEAWRYTLVEWCCSHPWAEGCWTWLERRSLLTGSASGNRKTCVANAVYPPTPSAPRWGMVACNCCSRPTPRSCIGSSGACDDCRYAALDRDARRFGRLPAQLDRADYHDATAGTDDYARLEEWNEGGAPAPTLPILDDRRVRIGTDRRII